MGLDGMEGRHTAPPTETKVKLDDRNGPATDRRRPSKKLPVNFECLDASDWGLGHHGYCWTPDTLGHWVTQSRLSRRTCSGRDWRIGTGKRPLGLMSAVRNQASLKCHHRVPGGSTSPRSGFRSPRSGDSHRRHGHKRWGVKRRGKGGTDTINAAPAFRPALRRSHRGRWFLDKLCRTPVSRR